MISLSRLVGLFAITFALSQVASAQNIGVEYCTSTTNSSGQAGKLEAFGIPSTNGGNMALLATQCPPNQPLIFFFGPTQAATPFVDGTLCISPAGNGITRIMPATSTDAAGSALHWLTHAEAGAPFGGPAGNLTRNYQAWFRDPAAQNTGSNTTSALQVDFLPCLNCQ